MGDMGARVFRRAAGMARFMAGRAFRDARGPVRRLRRRPMMKRMVLAGLVVLLAAAVAWAQMGGPGMMGGGGPEAEEGLEYEGWGGCPGPWDMTGPGMMGYGWGPGWGHPGWGMMGPGMMGPGMMGPGMMGPGMMGPGMMGWGHPGWGMMGPGMMGWGHRGWGMMGPGMMGYGWGPEHGEEYSKWLDETRDLRQQLHMKTFEYREALRNPEKAADLAAIRKEMEDLYTQIYKKAPWSR